MNARAPPVPVVPVPTASTSGPAPAAEEPLRMVTPPLGPEIAVPELRNNEPLMPELPLVPLEIVTMPLSPALATPDEI